jgi:Gpi18-like mannosyltransferase
MAMADETSLFKSLEKPVNLIFENKKFAWLLFSGLLALSLMLRIAVIPNVTDDMNSYLSWYHYILTHGGFTVLKDGFSEYTPPYLYLLTLGTYLNFNLLPDLTVIKLITIGFDFIGSWLIYKIIEVKYPNKPMPWIAFFTALFSPVVFLTSAYWGQVDMIYTVFLLAFTYALLKNKPLPAMIYFSIAFSFKFQAAFMAPLILILLLRKKIPWQYLLLPAPIYVIMMLPSWFAGRKMVDMLLIYFQQAGNYQDLSRNAPNLYFFLPNRYYNLLVPVGLLLAFLSIMVFVYFAYKQKRRNTPERFLTEAVLALSLLPFLLPKMHERYFFPASIFAIILAFYQPRFILVAVLYQLTSLLSYLPYLKGYPQITVNIAAVGNLGIIIYLIYAYFFTWRDVSPPVPTPG